MNSPAWGAIATLAVFVIANIGLMIHWSARISTLLEVVQLELKSLSAELRDFKGVYSTKEEVKFAREAVDREFVAIWKRIDELKQRGMA